MNYWKILFFVVFFNSVAVASNSIFYFSPDLTIRIGTQDQKITKRNLIVMSRNPEFKAALDDFLNFDSSNFINSLEENKITYQDYLNYLNVIIAQPNKIIESASWGPSCNNRNNYSEELFLRRGSLAINQLAITSQDASGGSLNQKAFNIYLQSLGVRNPVNLSQVSKKNIQDIIDSQELLGLSQRLRSAEATPAEMNEALIVLEKINLDGRMVNDVLTDEELSEFRSYRLLSRDQQLALLKPTDSAATVVVAAVVVTAAVAYHAVKSVRGICGESENSLIHYMPDDFFDPGKPSTQILDFSTDTTTIMNTP